MVALRLALTFLFSKKRYGIINAITWLAASVTVFVAAAMILILSAFNGIQNLVINLYSSIEAPYSISATNGETLFINNVQLVALNQLSEIEQYSLRCSGEVIFEYNKKPWYGTIVGSDNKLCKVSQLKTYLEYPDDCKLGEKELILGAGVRYKLQYPPQAAISPLIVKSIDKDKKINTRTIKNIRTTAFVVKNTFSVNAEYDLKYAFSNLSTAQNILGYKNNEYSSIECTANNITILKPKLEKILKTPIDISTEDDRLGDLKRTANIEKWISLLMLCLVLLIAAFNLIAAITMLIIDKSKDLETLKILGMTEQNQNKIFAYILLIINLGGALVGLAIGALLVYLQEQYGFIKISDSVVDFYPVKLHGSDALIILAVLCFTAILAQLPVRWVTKKR